MTHNANLFKKLSLTHIYKVTVGNGQNANVKGIELLMLKLPQVLNIFLMFYLYIDKSKSFKYGINT